MRAAGQAWMDRQIRLAAETERATRLILPPHEKLEVIQGEGCLGACQLVRPWPAYTRCSC